MEPSTASALPAPGPKPDWQALSTGLRGFLARRLPPDLVDDALQETLSRMVAKLPALRRPESLPAWMAGIARRVIVDAYRARAREPDALEIEVAEDKHGPDTLRELGACIQPMLATLPEAYRKTLTLADLEGFSHASIASALGLELSGVRARLARGRVMLKRRFEECCAFERNQRGELFDFHAKQSCDGC
jgi:RNA polymerase sigma-70 factor, ECF subfamily